MTIDSETSHKISRLQWICCLLVVLQHSVPNVNESIVCNIVAGCLTRVAVPFFFVLSGLLYFKSFSPSIAFAWNQVFKRTRPLLIPYAFFNLVGIMVGIVGGDGAQNLIVQGGAKLLRGDGIPGLSGHLWYIGMLFKIVVVGLPLGLFIERVGIGIPFIFLMAYFGGLLPIYSASLFFFSLGGVWSLGFDKHYENRVHKRKFLFCAILLSIGAIVATLLFPKYFNHSLFVIIYSIAAMNCLWFAYDLIEKSNVWPVIDKVAPASFFVYCVHPYFNIASIHYFIVRAILMLIGSLIVYVVMKKCAPCVLAIISGGRS